MASTSKSAPTRYQLLLALLVCAAIAGMLVSLLMAARDVTGVADADYYRHGLNYGRTRTGADNPGLCWTMTASLAGGDLQVRVTDRSGAPVTGGELRFQPAGGVTAPFKLQESAPGIFRARQPRFPPPQLVGTLSYRLGEAFADRKVVLLH